jgi:hypothetical protein
MVEGSLLLEEKWMCVVGVVVVVVVDALLWCYTVCIVAAISLVNMSALMSPAIMMLELLKSMFRSVWLNLFRGLL